MVFFFNAGTKSYYSHDPSLKNLLENEIQTTAVGGGIDGDGRMAIRRTNTKWELRRNERVVLTVWDNVCM